MIRFATLFEHDPGGMFTNSIPQTLQNSILAKGIPALSEPLGVREIDIIDENANFDMSVGRNTAIWCRNHPKYNQQWLHSDIQNVAYFYTHLLFNALVNTGELK